MIKGHGNDLYQYQGIRTDFSSNIATPPDGHKALSAYMTTRLGDAIGRYPEPEAWTLERRLAQSHGINPECVIVTNGATEAIYLVAQAFRLRHVIPTPTFSEYADACRMFTTEDSSRRMLWLCNPNNPDGRVYGREGVERWISEYDMTVTDQSYELYTREPLWCAQEAVSAGNAIVIHSMTKTYAVPGLRLGYIVTAADIAERLRRYMRPWAVSALAIEAGLFLLEHDELTAKPCLDEAQRLRDALRAIDGVSVDPTATSFMLGKAEGITAAELKHRLATEHGMLIRDASNFDGLTPHHFRVAAQTAAENDALVDAIKRIMNA